MMITYYQFYSILSKLEPVQGSKQVNFFLTLINIRAFLMAPAEVIFDLQCSDFKNLKHEYKYYALIIFQTLLPLIIFSVCLIMTFLGSIFTNFRRLFKSQERTYRRQICACDCQKILRRTKAATCILMYVVYPNMIEAFLSSVHCVKALKEGPGDVIVHRLRAHPDIFCDSKDYKWFKAFVFVPAIIVWVVLLPIYIIRQIFNGKEDIYNSAGSLDPLEDNMESKKADEIKARFGFLYLGLKINAKKRKTNVNEAAKIDQKNLKKQEGPTCYSRICQCFASIPKFFKLVYYSVKGNGLEIELRQGTSKCFSFFHWEIVVYFGKFFLIIITVFASDIDQDIQMNLALTLLAILMFIQLKNNPYERLALNNMHFSLLTTLLIVTYTRNIIKGFKGSYSEWRQEQVIVGYDPIAQEFGSIARLYEFNTNQMSYLYDVFVYLVIGITFYMDLHFLYLLYIQMLLYLKDRQKIRLYSWLTFKSKSIENKVLKEKQKDISEYQNEDSDKNTKSDVDLKSSPREDEDSSKKNSGSEASDSKEIVGSEKYDTDNEKQNFNMMPSIKQKNQELLQNKSFKPDPSIGQLSEQKQTARSNMVMNSSKQEFNNSSQRQDENSADLSSDQEIEPITKVKQNKQFQDKYEIKSQRSIETKPQLRKLQTFKAPQSAEDFSDIRSNTNDQLKPKVERLQNNLFLNTANTKTPGSRYVVGNLNEDSGEDQKEQSQISKKKAQPLVENIKIGGSSDSFDNEDDGQSNRVINQRRHTAANLLSKPSSSATESEQPSSSKEISSHSSLSNGDTNPSNSSSSKPTSKAIKVEDILPEIKDSGREPLKKKIQMVGEPQELKNKKLLPGVNQDRIEARKSPRENALKDSQQNKAGIFNKKRNDANSKSPDELKKKPMLTAAAAVMNKRKDDL